MYKNTESPVGVLGGSGYAGRELIGLLRGHDGFGVSFATCLAGERPANSDVAVEDSFERTDLGKGWKINTGEWKIVFDKGDRYCE